MRVRFYFQYKDGTDDVVYINGENDTEIKDQLDEFLSERNATFTSYEIIEEQI